MGRSEIIYWPVITWEDPDSEDYEMPELDITPERLEEDGWK